MPKSNDVLAFRRGLATGFLARSGVFALVFGGALLVVIPVWNSVVGFVLILAGVGLFVYLANQAMQIARDASEAPERIASGDVQGAEELLTATLRRFSIFPGQRVIQVHQLATLRQQQGKHRDVVELANAGLSVKLPDALRKDLTFLRLEAMLAVADYPAAHRELIALMSETHRLQDHARVTALRIRYERAIGAYAHMMDNIQAKVSLLQHVSGKDATEALAGLADAARAFGYQPLADHLTAKANALRA